MKKIVLLSLLLTLVAGTYAQKRDAVQYPWFAVIGGGATMWWGDNFRAYDLSDHTTPMITASVGYWFRPQLGLRVAYNGYSANSLSEKQDAYTICGKTKGEYFCQEFGYTHIHADVLWNLSSTICNYPRRFWEFIPYAGLGAVRTYRNGTSRFVPAVDLGLLNKIRLSRRVNLALDLSAAAVPDKADLQVTEIEFDVIAGGTLGVMYKF